MEYKCVFGGQDVTTLIPVKGGFTVNVALLGDPQPNVYKFLDICRNGSQTVVVGEHDYVASVTDGVPMCRHFAPLTRFLKNCKGLEIAGPSEVMRPLQIYVDPAHLDNMHLFTKPGLFVVPGKTSPGMTFYGDASDMSFIKPESYDFVFSSHMLEHTVNPLKILKEMTRVIKSGGHCVLVLPFKDLTFDHRRPITKFQHLLEHFEKNDTEQDSIMDHVTPELLAQYDFSRDFPAVGPRELIARCKQNAANRLFHVHVFDFALISQCMEFAGLQAVYFQLHDINQVVVGIKR